MGILDSIFSMDNVSPWGALYRVPQEVQGQNDRLKALLEAGSGAGMPIDLPPQVLAQSAFPDQNRPSMAPLPAPPPSTAFGGGASPFAFAGPAANMGPDLSAFQPQPPAPAAPQPGAFDPSVPLPVARPAAADRPAPVAPAPAPALSPRVANANAQADGGDGYSPAPQYAAPVSAPLSFGGRLEKGLMGFLGNLDKGPLGALIGGGAALATGRSTDPSSILAERQNATANALLAKGIPAVDVQAAINSQEIMKALLGQYYGKDKFAIQQVGESQDGGKQYAVFNSNDGTFKTINAGSDPNEAGGTIMFNGKPIQIPADMNRKEFIKKITDLEAERIGGKQTETQAKASTFASIMQNAEKDLKGLQNEGASYWGAATSDIPLVGNALQSENYQKYKQAQSAFITALLRQQSGAAISKSEFTRYEKEFFPQPGDSPDVIAQKAQQRAIAIDQMQKSAGPNYQPSNVSRGVTQSGLRWSVN